MFRPFIGNCRAAGRHVALLLAGSLLAGPAMAESWVSDATGVANDLFGASVSELEDVNGDGRWEFLVGVPGALSADGEVFLWYGGTGLQVADRLAWTGAANENFGWAVARIGDIDNDGTADFAVGAPLADDAGLDAGRVYVFLGGSLASGTAAARADFIIDGENGGDRFGWSVSAAGDMDGDGRDDFIVGAPRNDGSGLDAGAAYIIYGSGSGPSANLANATKLVGEIAGDYFGWSVCDAGNFLAGSEDCVAVGAPQNNTHGGMGAGAVYVFEGRTGNVNPDATADFTAGTGAAAKAGAQFGYCVRNAGRWSSDSYDDLAVGAPYCDEEASEAGRVEIFLGAAAPSTTAARSVDGEAAGDHLGWSLARGRDYAGTSAEDVLIGAPGSNNGGADAGRAYVYRGGVADVGTAAALDALPNAPVMAGTGAGDLYGQAVGSLGDVDGDGLWDVAVGAPGGNSAPSGATSGYVHLLSSGSQPVAAELRSWQARWLDGDDPGQVALAFELSAPAGGIASVGLARVTWDAQGRVAAREPLWSGPAVAGAAAAGVLGLDGATYRFADPGPAAPPPGGALAYEVTAITVDGRVASLGELEGPAGPAPAFGLAVAAFPNPARAQAQLSFRARAGEAVQVNVFDVRGRLVRHLFDGTASGAWMQAAWDGRDESGRDAAEGVYFLAAHAREGTRSRRLTLVR